MWSLSGVLVIVTILVIAADYKITTSTEDFLFDDFRKVPHQKAGLLLGTGKFLWSGEPNRYFIYRIDAAVVLYETKKIDYIIISGDNSQKDYNEPEDMKKELVKRGIPEDKIYLDYAGFRTYDSVIRIDKIFGQKSFIIISQKFHNERAVYIAKRLHMYAYGFNAKDVDRYNGFKTKLREKLARVKVFVDFLTGTEPKFLGEQVKIGGLIKSSSKLRVQK